MNEAKLESVGHLGPAPLAHGPRIAKKKRNIADFDIDIKKLLILIWLIKFVL